ncbi:hypothetical protein P691DRAFT_768172 [Macrolepiota fuliginosa MF-IS2]|uniref:Cleavage stimulation factor subunit 2 hinge domain-containing protein n=1 Tax=Macrolepiota fuliginosa MF-IS2 TaxID=1400762 RepID=A0A9P5WWL9_9AGAR|nr:hypothetical protein P691DRAFT_768172 [Macrolepiota fuliginosa MF-IS2]
MADHSSTEQLLELLIQLKKTTPKAARDILNNQPAIAYALISLMVSMGAINVEVFQLNSMNRTHEVNLPLAYHQRLHPPSRLSHHTSKCNTERVRLP